MKKQFRSGDRAEVKVSVVFTDSYPASEQALIDEFIRLLKREVTTWDYPTKSRGGSTFLSRLRSKFQRNQSLLPPNPYQKPSRQWESQMSPNSYLLERVEQPVLGWRGWAVERTAKTKVSEGAVSGVLRLKSMSRNFFLEEQPEVMEAVCLRQQVAPPASKEELRAFNPPHDAPDENCECGLYAVQDLTYLHQKWGMHSEKQCHHCVVGIVMGFGKVLFHGEYGWRSEKQKIVGFLDRAPGTTYDLLTHMVSRQFKLPMYREKWLRSHAAEFGVWMDGNAGVPVAPKNPFGSLPSRPVRRFTDAMGRLYDPNTGKYL